MSAHPASPFEATSQICLGKTLSNALTAKCLEGAGLNKIGHGDGDFDNASGKVGIWYRLICFPNVIQMGKTDHPKTLQID